MSFISLMIENSNEMIGYLLRHLELVGIAVGIGMIIAIPLGIFLTRQKRLASMLLALAGMIQTIPGLVMLGFALIFLGIGKEPALVVLSIYAILPILRNTYTGIKEVDSTYTEAAKGIGMTNMQILYKVEIPLAMSSIIGGIRISTVYIVSWATLASMIGAGGLGDPIWTGLATYNVDLILAGAVPSTILALVLSWLIGLLQRTLTPRGLRGVAA